MAGAEFSQLRGINKKLDSVIDCTCVDGCKQCALKVEIELPESEVLDCDGVASTVEALPTAIQGVVYTKKCPGTKDIETFTRCDINTGNAILVITSFEDGSDIPTITYWDVITNAAYTGNPATDLEVCADRELESDAQEMCDGTVNFLRWFVKENGEPTGDSYDTTLTGGVYTASGAEVIGACIIPESTEDLDIITDCAGTIDTKEVTGPLQQVVIHPDQAIKVVVDKSCDIAPTSRDVDVNIDCVGTTETVAVKDEFATEVVLKPNQNIEVTIDKSCDTTRDVDMLNNCDGTTEVIAVKDEAATEVIFNDAQVLKVAIDKSCDVPVVDRNIDVVDDCAGAVTSTAVSGDVAKEVVISGSTKPIEVRIKEDCTAPLIKSVTKTIDCDGATAAIDTTQTVEAVIDQVLDVKQCPKLETVSEIEVCAANVTLVKKTTIDSEGTETITFYGDNGAVVATPAAYTIGACAVPLTQDVLTQDDCAGTTSNTTVNSTVAIAGSMKTLNVRIVEDCVPNFDTELVSGCSSIDGRIIIRKVVKEEETGVETITLVEQDGVTLVTDASTLVACSGSDYETTEVCKKDSLDNYYKLVTFVNSGDTNDTFQIWMDVDGNIVPPVVGATDCEFSCESNMEFERCFDTGAGVVTAQGYYTLSATNIETYTSAKVIGSTDPAFAVGDNVLTQIPAWDQVTCQAPTVIVDRATTHSRTGGNNTYPANFRSFSITAVSADVTLNGQAMMQGFTVSLDSEENEQHITAQVVTGTDYFVTYVI